MRGNILRLTSEEQTKELFLGLGIARLNIGYHCLLQGVLRAERAEKELWATSKQSAKRGYINARNSLRRAWDANKDNEYWAAVYGAVSPAKCPGPTGFVYKVVGWLRENEVVLVQQPNHIIGQTKILKRIG